MSPCRSSLDVPCQGSAKVATLYEERFKNCFQNPFFYFNSINLLMRLLEHAQGRASSTRGDPREQLATNKNLYATINPKIVSLVAQRVLQVFDVALKRRDWTRSSISRNLRPGSCTRCISQTLSFFRTSRRMILLVCACWPAIRQEYVR